MIRFVFRWAFRLLVLVLLLLLGFYLLKDNLARSYTEHRIRTETGFDAKIGRMEVSLLTPRIRMESLLLYNPPEFGGSVFLDSAEIVLEYDPKTLPFRKTHLTFLRLNVRELNIVQNAGRTNLLEFLHPPSERQGSSLPARSTGYGLVGIDLLNLSLGRVGYSDLVRPKRNQVIALNVENEILRNVHSGDELFQHLLKLVFRAGISIYAEERQSDARRNPGRPASH